ncbi:hypothetical protein ACFYQA_06030 [Streptomyces sp. NPDC005774]|uniref:hypothetical protein n=1 Tax=Streptomyces sp. NPDC005774 TaxID=3364728 RepID=UPI003692CD28
MSRFVPWREAVLVVTVCWATGGLGYVVLTLLDEPHLSTAPLIGIGLVQWSFTRHRCWPAALAAVLAGTAVLFGLVDALRPRLDSPLAETLATGVAASVAVAVFTLVGRRGARRRDATCQEQSGAAGQGLP